MRCILCIIYTFLIQYASHIVITRVMRPGPHIHGLYVHLHVIYAHTCSPASIYYTMHRVLCCEM